MIFIYQKNKDKTNDSQLSEYLHLLKEGKYIIDIKKFYNKRSLAQNNYYHLYLTIIADETGEDKELLHELFKRKFLTPRIVKILGKNYKLPATTTKLDKLQFGEYISRIEILTGILAPDPNNYLKI